VLQIDMQTIVQRGVRNLKVGEGGFGHRSNNCNCPATKRGEGGVVGKAN